MPKRLLAGDRFYVSVNIGRFCNHSFGFISASRQTTQMDGSFGIAGCSVALDSFRVVVCFSCMIYRLKRVAPFPNYMKPKLILGLALVLSGILLTFDLSARITRNWTENELKNTSALVIVGTVSSVKDLDETNTLGVSEKFHGVETAFKVSHVLKGSFTNDEIVLHHYRYENDSLHPGYAPGFIHFSPFYTNEYVLYLVHDGTNRYAPVTGQFDAALSVKKPKTSKN